MSNKPTIIAHRSTARVRRQMTASGRWATLVVSAVACLMSSSVIADTLEVAGRDTMTGIALLSIHDGVVRYRLPSGWEAEVPLSEVKLVLIDGWEPFNRAERVAREGLYRQAAQRYEDLLAAPPANPGAAPDAKRVNRDVLLLCRLVRAYDAIGRFDQAVTAFVTLCRRMPGDARSLRPSKLPPTGSTLLTSAGAAITRAVSREPEAAWARQLVDWRRTWPAAPADTAAPADLPAPEARAPQADRDTAAFDQVAAMIEKSSYPRALALLDGMGPLAGEAQPEGLYWRGRALEGLGSSGKSAEEAAHLTRAGLAYMRVVILHAKHERARECLRRAAEICALTGDQEGHQRLLIELKDRYDDPSRDEAPDTSPGEPETGRSSGVKRPSPDSAAQRIRAR